MEEPAMEKSLASKLLGPGGVAGPCDDWKDTTLGALELNDHCDEAMDPRRSLHEADNGVNKAVVV